MSTRLKNLLDKNKVALKFEPEVGDLCEFLSDRVMEKGPCITKVLQTNEHKTSFSFDEEVIVLETSNVWPQTKTKTEDGLTLWELE